MPSGFMMGNILDGQFLVLCTANGVSLEFIEFSHDQKIPSKNDLHSTLLCQLSSANAASILAALAEDNFTFIAAKNNLVLALNQPKKITYQQHQPRAPPALT